MKRGQEDTDCNFVESDCDNKQTFRESLVLQGKFVHKSQENDIIWEF